MASYLGTASPIRNTQHLVGASQQRRDAPTNQAFFYDTFDVYSKNVTMPVPADIVARVKQEIPDLRSPSALQLISRELKRRFGSERVTGQIYFAEDFEQTGAHATLPIPKSLGEAGKHISTRPADAETTTQALGREFGAEGGRMEHAKNFEQFGEHAHKPEARGITTGEMSKRGIAGVGRQSKPIGSVGRGGGGGGGGGGAPSMKHGGIVHGKKGQAVPIVAHAGELVVPVKAVDKVLKSSAWIDHVKSVQKAQGISYKEAMKVAKGSYKK